MTFLQILCSNSFIRKLISWIFQPKETNNSDLSFKNILFKNRVGLAAGFDKNAIYLRELETLGFGFVEIGTVTPLPQKGNPAPRIFRLPKDKALINRMGFNNDGVEVIKNRLKKWKKKNETNSKSKLIIGGNIGKNKETPNEDAWKDYEICFRQLHPFVDYFVVNVSSPNTPGLRELQEKDFLLKILTGLQSINQTQEFSKPIFLKIAPDLSLQQIDDIAELALQINLDGLVATNTTLSRTFLQTPISQIQKIGLGGLSGAPLKQRSTEIINHIHQKTKGQIFIIASGGIFSGKDAKEKLDAGASLVQIWTGFIYEGPGIIKNICKSINV